jgi:hypothetical protein
VPDTLIRAMVTIPRITAIPEDAVQNVWHFDSDDDAQSLDQDADWVMELVEPFYVGIQSFMASYLGAEITVTMYNMRDVQPRVPFAVRTFAFDPGEPPDFPAEVSQCLSMAATVASGENAARKRGRLYLGPLRAATGVLVNGDVRPGGGFNDTVETAATPLLAGASHAAIGAGSTRWSIYSPTTDAASSIDDAFHDVTRFWLDNAFDTQRRRGARATSRQGQP